MIKRTPQEIADFFGCYVFEAETEGDFYVTKQKPIQDYDCYVMSVDDGALGILSEFVSFPADHDRTHLYEPQTEIEGCPHQSEVHTHKEYKVVCYTYENSLNEAITSMMAEGWKPQGSIAMVYLGEIYSPPIMFAQAMVRGL